MIERRVPTYTDHSGEFLTERMAVNGPDEMSLDEVLLALKQAEPYVVFVHQAFFSWVRPSTEEEKQKHHDYNRDLEERKEKWEHEMYLRLKRKYETIHYSETEDMGS